MCIQTGDSFKEIFSVQLSFMLQNCEKLEIKGKNWISKMYEENTNTMAISIHIQGITIPSG